MELRWTHGYSLRAGFDEKNVGDFEKANSLILQLKIAKFLNVLQDFGKDSGNDQRALSKTAALGSKNFV